MSKSTRNKILLRILGFPALLPLLFMLPAIVTLDSGNISESTADVLGTGAEALLLITLLITPLVTITGRRWFIPLRKWYGIMTGITAVTDGILAGLTTTDFGPYFFDRLIDHPFLVIGTLMVAILVPLVLISNNVSMKRLGRYWRKLQKLTYVVWALLGIHLAILFNLGPHSGGPVLHQRFYQYVLCSLPLIFYRLPIVRKATISLRKNGMSKANYLLAIPWAAIFILTFLFIINEEVFKGVAAFLGSPIDN